MLPSILYVFVRLILDLMSLQFRDYAARDVELLVLRHEVRVLRRQTKRLRWHAGDRLVFAALSRWLPRTGWNCFPVRPETLLRGHRESGTCPAEVGRFRPTPWPGASPA